MGKSFSGLFSGTKGENKQSNPQPNRKPKLSKERLDHSSAGNFKKNGKMISGGHGQENIEILKKLNIKYEILYEYPNGVRSGNVLNHINKGKREGGKQLWFPHSWTRNDIKAAGETIAESVDFSKLDDGGLCDWNI